MNQPRRISTYELSPSQHRAIRRQICLLPLYGWSIYIWHVCFEQLPLSGAGETAKVFRDFAHFYILGTVARIQDASLLFNDQAQKLLLFNHVPGHVDVSFPPAYGPQVAMLFRPLAALPYVSALIVWMVMTVALYLSGAWLLWRECPNLRDKKWPLFFVLTASPALHLTLMYGQTAAIATLCFVAAFVSLNRGRPFLAGLAIGCLFYKPQLGLGAALLFVAAGDWRVIGGALTSITAQMSAAALYWGLPVLKAYAEALLRIPGNVGLIEPDKHHLHAWRSFFQLLGLDGTALLAATVVASVATVGGAIVCWKATGDLRLRFTILLTTTVLINPHMYVYDMMVLTPAGLLLWDYLAAPGTPVRASTALTVLLLTAFASPILGFVAPYIHVQPSVVVLALLMVTITALSLRAPFLLRSTR